MEKIKILAIDDNADNLVVLKALLDEAFPDVTFISSLSGKKGIELCLAEKPDVILLDIVMPEMDGYEVCQILKADEATKTIPVVMLTAARTDKESRIKALESGADAFLAKPVDESELTAQIRTMLRIKESEDRKLDEKERLKSLVEERTSQLEAELNERKLAENALKESEEKYSVLFQDSPDSYLIILDGVFIDCNKATEFMLRGDRTQIIGQTPNAVSPEIQPDGRKSSDSAAEKIAWAFENGKNTFEWMHRRFDGSDLYVEVSIAPMMLKGKQTLFTTWRDISARKTAEQALQESETQFRKFFEKAADAIFIAEIESGIILDVNEAATRLMNRNYEQLIGIHQSQLHPTVKEKYTSDTFEKHKELVKQKVNSYAIENFVLRADGTEVPVEILASEVDYHGKRCMMGTFRDITERKKSEEAIQISEARYRYMFQNNPQTMWIYDHETLEILEVNEVSTKIYGYSREEFLSMTIKEIRPAEDIPLLLDDVKASRLDENSLGEWRHVKKNGEIMNVEISASSIVFNGRKARHVLIKDITERKRAEELLRESEYFFKESQRAAFVGSYKFNLVADYWTSSEVLEQIFGIDKNFNKSLQGWMGIVHPDDREAMTQYFMEEVIGKRQPLNKEYRIVSHLDGDIRWVLGLGRLNFDANGNVIEMIGTIQDISERKLAEIKLSEVNQRFTDLVASTDGIVWEADAGTFNFSFVSKNAERILGYDTEDWLQPGFWANHIFEDDRDNTVQFCIDQTSQCNNHDFEYRFITQNGRTVWLADFVKVIKENGKPVSLHGLMVDITERKQSEEKVKESQQLFQELFDASPDAIVLIDPHDPFLAWTIVDCNKAACQMNGYSREEMIGQSIDILNLTLAAPEERISYLNQLRKEEVLHVESSHQHKDGHIFPVEISTSLVTIGGREMVLGIDRDITDRKKTENELADQKQRLADILLGTNAGTWIWNIQTGEVILNDRWAEIIGYNLDELKPISISTWISNVHPDDLPAANKMLNKHFNGELEYFDVEFRQPHKDGNWIWVNARGKVIEWTDDGKPLWMSGTHLDITERKLAEENLHESEDRYRSFISQVTEGVYRFECDEPMDLNMPLEAQVDFIYDHFFIAECNDALLKMYKITDRDEIVGKSHLDFHGGRDNTVNRNLLREFIRKGYSIEAGITEEFDKTGQLRYISNNSVGIVENNHLVRLWGTETDITEKIRTDQIQQVLFSISNAALSSIDLPKLIEFISEEVGKLLDSTNFYIAFYDEKTDMLSTIYERDEKDFFETWPAENSITGYVVKQQKSLLLKEQDVDAFYKASGLQAHGTAAKVWLGVPLVTNKKTVGAIVVQSYDNVDAYTEKDQQMLEFISHQIGISIDRKRTEKDLKLMGKAFDQSPVTIVITDRTGNIEYVNPKFSETTGYTLDEVRGNNPRILQSGNQSQEYYQELWKTISDGNDWFGEFQNKRKNGESYWESAVISPITNENGDISFFLAIKEDITEKKKMIDDLIQARNKAEESDRLKSSFLANMSHEIRTPLNSIIGFSELLLDEDFGHEQHDEFARTINESGNGLLTIISDIMDLSKIEAGQVQIRKKNFSVPKLINDIQREYSHKASSKGIELRLDLTNPTDEIFIESDEQRIRQVLINFVGNAIKFTEEGFIEIGFGIESGRDKACLVSTMRFYVKDTGIGIPHEFHQEIFERFRQVESSHTRKYGGNGLGLAISKNLVELLGGEIGMESEKGKGSTFYFSIPYKD